ncbi:MAG TPA: thioredoxin-like domain-containing protein [Saprospiraceae bacterium]|nr:thioredoxin-like domain-containing protein [Saprospiraceae bacterium]HMQ82516.1 thioredoxin-like domain-containing protein [Saprospiraceae bacterium]
MRPLILILCLISFWACNNSGNANGIIDASRPQIPAEAPDFSIQIEGIGSGQAAMVGTYGERQFKVDSTTIDATGYMHFKRDEPYPSGLYYFVLPDKTVLQFLIDVDQTFTMKTRAGDVINSMQVEGSKDNELLYANLKFEAENQPFIQQLSQQLNSTPSNDPRYQQLKKQQDDFIKKRQTHLQDLYKQAPNSFFVKYKQAGQNPELRDIRLSDGSINNAAQVYHYRMDFWNNVDFSHEGLIGTPVIFNKLKRYINELTAQHPDSICQSAAFLMDKVEKYPKYAEFFANWIVLNYDPAKTSLMDSDAVFVFMIQNYFTYEKAHWADSAEIYSIQLRAHEMASSLIGKKGPDVQAKDPNGKLQSIYAIQSPYIIVYMYNPTCEHCMEQTPKLVNFYRQWKSKGVEVFGIALDTDQDEWKAYIAKNGMDWINVFDPSNKSIYAKYFVDHTPELYVLNPERIIIGKNLKVNQVEEIIRRDQEKR